MTNPFHEIRNRVLSVRDNIDIILRESVRESASVIEDKIIEQLERGERGDGEKLPDYSPVSVAVYGKRPGPMTLRDTGDYHMDHFVTVDDDGFEIRNRNWKTPKLAMMYGREILELQSTSFMDIKSDILTESIFMNINRFILYGKL